MIDAHFVQRVVEAASAGSASVEQSRLRERMPAAAKQVLDALSGSFWVGSNHASFSAGETLLLALDEALGDGSGSVLERAGRQFASLYLTHTLGGRLTGDVVQCLERLRRVVLDSFHYPELCFEVTRIATGLNLEIRVGGAPRAARILRHLSVGFVQAAYDFALEASSSNLRVFADTTGDRCSLTARYRLSERPEGFTPDSEPESQREPRRAGRMPTERTITASGGVPSLRASAGPKTRSSTRIRPSPEASLSAEVERILGPSRFETDPNAWGAEELPYTLRLPRAPRVPVFPGG
jgi:hypothetical protein